MELFDLSRRKPLLHISSMFSADKGCAALVMPLMMHPVNKNAVVVFNLMSDPQPLLQLSSQEIIERLYTRNEDLPDGVERLPLKLVHLNKSPMLCVSSVLDETNQQRLQIDLELCRQHWKLINTAVGQGALLNTLRDVYTHNNFAKPADPECMLYQGFFNYHEKQTMADVRLADEGQLSSPSFEFDDPRLDELLFRYRARNFPQSLSSEEQERWQHFCFERLTDPDAGGAIILEDYFERIAQWRLSPELTESQVALLDKLEEYGDSVLA
jgi:exodeoxyribonuclease-1